MPQCLEARAPMGGRSTGTAWVHGALQRLIGVPLDLRKGGLQTPEEMTAGEALSIVNRLTETLRKEKDQAGHTVFVLRPPTVISGGGLGPARAGGAVAALYDRTKTTAEQAILTLEKIEPLDPCCDPTDVRSTMAIIRNHLQALITETEVDPRSVQMDGLFRALLDDEVLPGDSARGYIGHFQRVAGLTPENIKLMGGFEQYTRFLMVRDSVQCLRASWMTWRREDRCGELGRQYVRAAWLFQAVRETIVCYRRELDEVCVGDATLRTMPVNFPTTQDSDHPVDSLPLDGFLDLVEREAGRWERMLTDGGLLAVPAIRNAAHNIHGLVRRAIGELGTYADLVVAHEPPRRDRRGSPQKHLPETTSAPPAKYEIFKADQLRSAHDVAQRLGALLQEIEDELHPSDEPQYPPEAEQKAI